MRLSTSLKTLGLSLILACLAPLAGTTYSTAAAATPGVTATNDDLEAMKANLITQLTMCQQMCEVARSELQAKATSDEAPELYARLYSIISAIEETYMQVQSATTENELYNCMSMIASIQEAINNLRMQIDAYAGSSVFTATTVEGVEMTFKIISEDDKTCQVGIGKSGYAAIDRSTNGVVTIPSTADGYQVVAVSDYAFERCNLITSVNIPEAVTSIGYYTFWGCDGLTTLHIPASITNLNNRFLGDSKNLTSLTVAEGNTVYNSPEGSNAIVETATNTLRTACNTTAVPEGVTIIGSFAFEWTEAIEYIDMPDGVCSFDDYAFYFSGVKHIIIGGITQLGFSMGAFNHSKIEALYLRKDDGALSMYLNGRMWRNTMYNAPVFEEYVIPEEIVAGDKTYALTSLGPNAFYNCSELTTLTIPATITAIEGSYAFHGCTALRTINSYITEPFAFDAASFEDATYAEATLYVLAGTKALYQTTDGWKNFQNIVEMGDSNAEPYVVVSEDGQIATFYYDGQKESRGGVDIKDGPDVSFPYSDVTSVVIDASFANYRPTSTKFWFDHCKKLTSVSGIENLNTTDVTEMTRMFSYCSSLTSLDLSHFNTENVTEMLLMFRGCSSLTSLDLRSFNTANVTDMMEMFGSCSSLTSLDLSSFNTANVTEMRYLFDKCAALKTIYVDEEKWSTANIIYKYDHMFRGCTSLVGGNGTAFDTNHTDAEYARIDKEGQPGYLTQKSATGIRLAIMQGANSRDVWHTLGGQHISGQPTEKGVYIQNGRKVVVK